MARSKSKRARSASKPSSSKPSKCSSVKASHSKAVKTSSKHLEPSSLNSGSSAPTASAPTVSAEKRDAPEPPKLPNQEEEEEEEPEHLADYGTVTARAEKLTWLAGFMKKWTDEFSWHTGEEPEEFAVLNIPPSESSLSEDERNKLLKKREALQEEVQARAASQVVNWMHRYVGKVSEPAKPKSVDPFASLLKLLKQIGKGELCRTEDAKSYMCHEKYKPKVQAKYDRRIKENPEAATGGSTNHLDFRVKIARELWDAEEKSVWESVSQENEAVFQKMCKLQDKLLEGRGPDCRQGWRDHWDGGGILRCLLLDLLHHGTGLNFFLVGGAPPVKEGEEYYLMTVSAGESPGLNPRKFESWQPDYFLKYVIGLFMMFMSNKHPSLNYNDSRQNTGTRAATLLALDSILNNSSLLQMPDKKAPDLAASMDTDSKKRKANGRKKSCERKSTRQKDDDTKSSAESSEESCNEEANVVDEVFTNAALSTPVHGTSSSGKTCLAANTEAGSSQLATPIKNGPPVYGPIVLPSSNTLAYIDGFLSEEEHIKEVQYWDMLHPVELTRRMEYLDLRGKRHLNMLDLINDSNPPVHHNYPPVPYPAVAEPAIEESTGYATSMRDDDIGSAHIPVGSSTPSDSTPVPPSITHLALTPHNHSSTAAESDLAPTPVEPGDVGGKETSVGPRHMNMDLENSLTDLGSGMRVDEMDTDFGEATSSSDVRDELTNFTPSNSPGAMVFTPSSTLDPPSIHVELEDKMSVDMDVDSGGATSSMSKSSDTRVSSSSDPTPSSMSSSSDPTPMTSSSSKTTVSGSSDPTPSTSSSSDTMVSGFSDPTPSNSSNAVSGSSNPILSNPFDSNLSNSSVSSTTAISTTPDILASKDSWPRWVREGFDSLLQPLPGNDVGNAMGEVEWSNAMKAWVVLERAYSFSSPNGAKSAYPTEGHPIIVQEWFKNRKTAHLVLPKDYRDIAEFGEQCALACSAHTSLMYIMGNYDTASLKEKKNNK
ncbi:hypothetical protein BT96DRAFT_944700 [Gymnopus androsaceus JB14]|uniref:Uncharacterized protein n=1 Tax=Gymnopus androsaceus JB14 TaxID=1447944 RepID=A0A6A4H3I5_9AGAR|nr:hypothetical protein BT96DRAFT_944700 [Gymnopus androsaceus JB14]